jgi:hypothetical protein
MKSHLRVVLVAACVAAPFACGVACGGGQAAQDGPRSPAGAATSASSAGAAPASEGTAVDSTTTSSNLGDPGDAQAVKLAEAHPTAAASASAAPAPKVAHTHDPGRGSADIRAMVVAHRDEARACYDAALEDHPGIEGDIVIDWTIDPKGNVTDTSLDSSRSQMAEPTLVACLAGIIKKIQFAASPGGFESKAFYPFNFHPHHQRHGP